jgi:hypothetical protein
MTLDGGRISITALSPLTARQHPPILPFLLAYMSGLCGFFPPPVTSLRPVYYRQVLCLKNSLTTIFTIVYLFYFKSFLPLGSVLGSI